MIKRLIGLLISILLGIFMSACSDDTIRTPIKEDDEKGQVSVEDKSQIEDIGQEKEPEDGEPDAVDEVTIDSMVLVDQEGLTITAQELVKDSIWGMGIKILIENDSDENLGVQCKSLVVNNYMISDLFSSSVSAGKKANDTIYLSSSGLEAAGITSISDVVVSFHIFDDDYETLFDTDEIEIKTSEYGIIEQPVMDDGKELLNQDGVRIVGKYVEEDTFWGAGVLLFIENNYEQDIVVQCDNMSINGFMVTPFFSCTVNNGRMALDSIDIMSSDLEDNSIETVDDIELVFNIMNADTYETLKETDIITFSTK